MLATERIVAVASKPSIEVAAGILVDVDRRILLSERPAKSSHVAGFWEFPGGKLEPGESPHDALVRELQEEIDIVVAAARFVATHRHDYRERDVTLHFFLVREWRGTPRSVEGQRLAWARVNEIDDYNMLPGDEPIIRTLPALLRA